MDSVNFTIPKYLANKTIREVLLDFHLGKDKIHQYKMNKSVYINGVQCEIEQRVNENDLLSIVLKESIDVMPVFEDIEVVYEDKYFLLVNKPRGILIHDDGNSDDHTLVNLVAGYYKNHRIRRKLRFCNRIDFDTEGIVCFAKDPISEAYLNNLIAERKVIKKYYAITYNHFSKNHDVIDLPISSNRHEANKMIVYKKGKEAKTEYNVIKNGKISLVDVILHTGRTHQIRVHMAHNNHPLLGDKLYGKDDNYELMLQAYYFKFFNSLIGKEVEVKLEMSPTLKQVL